MSFTTRRYPLTKDQKARGVIYSSQITNYSINSPGELHEVFRDDADARHKIELLEDVGFFRRMCRGEGWRAVNTIRE